MKHAFASKRFGAEARAILDHANSVILEYQDLGFLLTLRQLYYQLVSRTIIPNTVKDYKRLGDIVSRGRLCGEIDWAAIEDRTRNVEANQHWDGPWAVIHSAARSYRLNLWSGQLHMPEVWVEKDALESVISSVCEPLDVPYLSCRGYASQTAMYEASNRIHAYGCFHEPVIFHFGDHDPSGIDMTRDIFERLQVFGCFAMTVKRIALTMEQVEQYSLPPNPAKETDTRFAAYADKYGEFSWELDALPPDVLAEMVTTAIDSVRDISLWEETQSRQEQQRAELKLLAAHYTQAINSLDSQQGGAGDD